MMQSTTDLEDRLKYHFNTPALLVAALTHPSYLNENKVQTDSYQRLEFLGDAILEFVVSEYLFQHFPDIREGRLTEIRAAMVRTENLALCARKLQLGNYLFISKGEEQNNGRNNDNILADVLEALIAALYLDSQQLTSVRQLFSNYIQEELETIIRHKLYLDSKTELQERIQAKFKLTPVYRLLKDNLPDGFEVGVYLNDECLGVGRGKNKRLAEQQAAKNALGNKQIL